MTNLERYLGIRVFFSTILHPYDVAILKERAREIFLLRGISPDDFYVYVHRMTIVNNDRHFIRRLPLEEKIESLSVTFKVNPKQVKQGHIRFYNSHVTPMENSPAIAGETILIRRYDGHIKNGAQLQTEIITYISKDLRRESHKKIKAQVEVTPTSAVRELHEIEKQILTQVDLHFNVQLEINFSDAGRDERDSILKARLADCKRVRLELLRQERLHEDQEEVLRQIIQYMEEGSHANALSFFRRISNETFELARTIDALYFYNLKPDNP